MSIFFLFTKKDRYWLDGDAVRVPDASGSDKLRPDVWTVPVSTYRGAHFAVFPPELIEPCVLAGCPEGGTVLDPFAGVGTTAGVALRHGRNAILCELNPEYGDLVEDRVHSISGLRGRGSVVRPTGVTSSVEDEAWMADLI